MGDFSFYMRLPRLLAETLVKVLQFMEDVYACTFRVGNQPGRDLLPHPLKRVFMGVTPAQHAFSPLLLSV